MRVQHRSSPHGFTLLELLVALFILAVLSVLSYRTVAAMTDTRAHVDQAGRRFDRLAGAVAVLERDLAYVVQPAGELPLRGDGGTAERPGELRFFRTGPAYPSGPQEVARQYGYRFRDGRLEKLVYPAPWELAGEPEVRPLLTEGLTGLRFRFRDVTGAWRDTWPVEGASGLPRAVEARLVLADGGEITRLCVLP